MASQMIPIGRLQVATPRSMALAVRQPTDARTAVDERISAVAAAIIAGDETVTLAAATAVGDALAERQVVEADGDGAGVLLEWGERTTDYVTETVLNTVGASAVITVPRSEVVPRIGGDGLIDPSLLPPAEDLSEYPTRSEVAQTVADAMAGVSTDVVTSPGVLPIAAGLAGGLTFTETSTTVTVTGTVTGTITAGMSLLSSPMLPVLPGVTEGGVRTGLGMVHAVTAGSSLTVAATFPKAVLPVVSVVTDDPNVVIDNENYVRATVRIDVDGTGNVVQTFTTDFRGHGNSTWLGLKKPYRLKADENVSLLGIAAGKHWRLLANYYDYSRVRPSAYYAAGEDVKSTLGWTPNGRWVQLVINGRPVGLYDLRESVRIGSERLAITEMQDTDVAGVEVTGGWLLEISTKERNDPTVPGFLSGLGTFFAWDNPEEPTPEQETYIRARVAATEAAISASGVGYRDYIDEDSFIDWYWINELLKNSDSAFWSSCKIHKPRATLDTDGVTIVESRFRMGPLWDADLSIGATLISGIAPAGMFRLTPDGWLTRNPANSNVPTSNWYTRLWQRTAFRDAATARWFDYWAPRLESHIIPRLEATAREVSAASALDHPLYGEKDGLGVLAPRLTAWLRARAVWITDNL